MCLDDLPWYDNVGHRSCGRAIHKGAPGVESHTVSIIETLVVTHRIWVE